MQYTTHTVDVTRDDCTHDSLFVGINATATHTVEKQLSDWMAWFQRIHDVLNSSPQAATATFLWSQLYENTKGMHSDHASDVKAVAAGLRQRKQDSDRYERGRRAVAAMQSTEGNEYAAAVLRATAGLVQRHGGPAAFEQLDPLVQQTLKTELERGIMLEIGEREFQQLSKEQQADIDEWFWFGCCMHKDLNAVVYAYKALTTFWRESGLLGPIRLVNKDNTAAAAAATAAGDTASKDRAEATSTGGAVKFLQLLGAVLRNKDTKKGQQDSYKWWMEDEIGWIAAFPDTSNTRFQSYCAAAAYVILHLDEINEFMDHIYHHKDKVGFTNIEQNCVLALKDEATVIELAVMALYYESVSRPYCRRARAHGVNALDLGPLHEATIAWCGKVAEDPQHVLGHTQPTKAALYGNWDEPRVLYAIIERVGNLPHLSGAISAFFGGARDGWVRFATEWASGSAIAEMTPERRARRFVSSTNCLNEGILGSWRIWKRRHPNGSVALFNATTRYRMNGTYLYEAQLSAADLAFARKQERLAEMRRRKRLEKSAIVRFSREKVQRQKEKAARAAKARASRGQKLDDVEQTARQRRPEEVTKELMSSKQMKLELMWHRNRGVKGVLPKSKELTDIPTMIPALRAAIVALHAADPKTLPHLVPLARLDGSEGFHELEDDWVEDEDEDELMQVDG